MIKLTQKKNFVLREFKLSESKLFYNLVKYGNGNEVDIPYENIDGEKVRSSTTNYLLFVVAIGCLALTIGIGYIGVMTTEVDLYFLAICFGVLAFGVFVYYWFTRETYWKIKLSNNTYIHFLQNVPDEETTEKFISELIKSRDIYLRDNYFVIDENLNYVDQLQNFRWLKSINAITKKEFDEKYSELKKLVKPEVGDIGFGK